MKKVINIPSSCNGLRLDKALSLLIEDKSRTYLLSLLNDGLVLCNGKIEKPSYKVKENDVLEVTIPEVKPLEAKAENIPLDIIYEDEDIIIINKPQGIVVHPSAGHDDGTIVNAILYHSDSLSGINGVLRPGIVHRIDKDTSGLLCIAKNDDAHHFLSEQLKDHTMQREYYALAKGIIKENNGMINLPIGRDKTDRQKMGIDPVNGKEAVTYFHVEERFKNHTLITCKLKTGRTHQIRVHLSYIKHPVEGDTVYGKKKDVIYQNGQLLHAYRLTLIHPRTKKEMTFTSPLPDYFKEIIEKLRNE